MSERHVMIDLETMSTRPDAAIVSIGAYLFDPYGDDREADGAAMFRGPVSLQSSLDAGLRLEGETVEWWLQQSDEARLVLTMDPPPLGQVLARFARWVDSGDGRWFPPENVVAWSHAAFDFPILDNAYRALGMTPPWRYRSPRDLRTIIHAAYGRNLDIEEVEPDFPVNPVEHDAAWDAWHQAVMVQWCFRRLRAPSVREGGS